jgi:hypothetical protein
MKTQTTVTVAGRGRSHGALAWAAGTVLVLFASEPGRAAPGGTAPAVQAVLACRTVKDDAARLDCFDKATAAMGEAETKGDLLTLDREQRRAVRKQAFGLTLPALNLFDRGEKPEEADRITATVASATQDPYGKWTIRLDDGAVWRQTDSNEISRPPHKGSTVVIKKGVLGSFFIDVDGQPGVRAHRDA